MRGEFFNEKNYFEDIGLKNFNQWDGGWGYWKN